MDLHFWIALSSLLIIVIYAVMVFRNVDPLVATAICVGVGFLYNLSNPIEIGKTFEHALGSFLALVGFIIMLGRGLGEILTETKVSHTLVYKIVYGIGVNTKIKVKVGILLSVLIVVGILGTLAGGIAAIAPILRPIAAKVRLPKPVLAVLMQAAGEEALILGPFAPPVVTVLGVTGLTYTRLLIWAAIPIALVTLFATWIMANKLQKIYANEVVDAEEDNAGRFEPDKQQILSTTYFILAFISCLLYGLLHNAGTSFVVFVMLFLSITTGLVARIKISHIFELIIQGMQKNFHLFFIFLLLDPFLNLVQNAGGFAALAKLFVPLEHLGGKSLLSILIGLTGAFGMPAASAAVIKMLYQIFSPTASMMQLSMATFAFTMLLATRITNFVYPGGNMFAAMGFAGSTNIKAMIRNGLFVAMCQIMFLMIYSLIFG